MDLIYLQDMRVVRLSGKLLDPLADVVGGDVTRLGRLVVLSSLPLHPLFIVDLMIYPSHAASLNRFGFKTNNSSNTAVLILTPEDYDRYSKKKRHEKTSKIFVLQVWRTSNGLADHADPAIEDDGVQSDDCEAAACLPAACSPQKAERVLAGAIQGGQHGSQRTQVVVILEEKLFGQLERTIYSFCLYELGISELGLTFIGQHM